MTPVRKLFAPELARRCAETLLPFALLSARDDEVAEGRALAARLIGEPIVATDDFRRVHRRSGMGLFLAREEGRLTGILAFVPLTSEGVEALLADRFDGRAPIDAHVAGEADIVCGLYGWGVAAATRDTAVRLVAGARAAGQGPLAHLPYYARPITEAGERLMREKLGFVDLPGSRSGLVWLAPFLSQAAA